MDFTYFQEVTAHSSDIFSEKRTIFDRRSGEILFEAESYSGTFFGLNMNWQNNLDNEQILEVINSFFKEGSPNFYQARWGKIEILSDEASPDSELFIPLPLQKNMQIHDLVTLSQDTLYSASCDLHVSLDLCDIYIHLLTSPGHNRGVNMNYSARLHNSLVTGFFKATESLMYQSLKEKNNIILEFQNHVKPYDQH